MAGLIMGFAVFWFFSTPSLQQMWLALRWAAIIPILLTSLLGIWHYLVTLKPIDAQMLDANVFAITQYLGFFLLLSLPAPIKRSEMLVRTLALFLLMFAFFATYSRSGMGAWLGSFGGIVVLSLIKPLFSKRYLLSIVGVTLLAAMVLARTVYLARALGYLKRPMLAPRRSVLAVPIVLQDVSYLCDHGVGGFQKSIHGSWLPASTSKLGEVYRFCPECTDPRPG